MTRHADFEKIYADFHEVRDDEQALILYLRFLDQYGLDESQPYAIGAQTRLRELALKSQMHQDIKKQYPMFGPGYWDSYVLGIRKSIGRRIKLRTDHPLKFKLKNIGGRRLKIRFTGGEN